MRRKLLFMLLTALLLASLSACQEVPVSESDSASEEVISDATVSDLLEIVKNDATEYVIVRDDSSATQDANVQGTIKIHNAVNEALHVDIPLTTDWVNVNRGEEIPTDTKEILVGKTNRPESTAVLDNLGNNEYIIQVVGDRIVINATSDEALALAIDVFLTETLGYDAENQTCTKNTMSLANNYRTTGKYVFNIEERENAVISTTPQKYNAPTVLYQDGVYYQKFDPWNVTGCLSTMQVACSYSDIINVNSDSVMVYTTNADTVGTWEAVEDRYNIDMMIAINRAELAWAEEHPDAIQTRSNGSKMMHGAGASYYMVPTEEFIEYTWDIVEWSLKTYRPTTIAFEEPEMWNESGYSDGFKKEWKNYFGEDWEDPMSSPEAMLKCMELKTYLFERIIGVMAERMAEIAPNTNFYIATHSTTNYNAWGITAGLNHYMATGEVDGVIGQTWSDTIRTEFLYNGREVVDEYLNAYIDFTSYMDSVEGTNFYALADPMADNAAATEESNRYSYLQTIVASLMRPEIHRFEICPWTDRAFGRVSTSYRTILQQCFNALNEVGGKEITLEAGTPGIAYAVSDTVSWLKNGRWAPETSDSLYGITMPLAIYGIPISMKSMEQIYTAADLEDVKVLILSYDNQLPMDEAVNDAIAEWVKDGGTLMLLSGRNDFWSAEDRFWVEDKTPIDNLLKKLGVNASVSEETIDGSAVMDGIEDLGRYVKGEKVRGTYKRFAIAYESEYESILTVGEQQLGFETAVGEGHLLAVGLPSLFYTSESGCKLMRALTEYAVQYTDLEYVETNLMTIRRGNVIATHALRFDEKLDGTYIDLYDENLSIVRDPLVEAKNSRLLYAMDTLDLSVPRFAFSSGELVRNKDGICVLSESSEETTFSYTAAASSMIATRVLAPVGSYPETVKAVCAEMELPVIQVWDNKTSSLLLIVDGYAQQTDVTITWGDTPVADGQNIYYIEENVKVNNLNLDREYLVENTASANDGLRFCDFDGKLVYKLDISEHPDVKFMLSVTQNYIVEVSSNGKDWTMVADYSQGGTVEHIRDAGNATILDIYPAQYDITDTCYFRIRNSNTSMGWGGSLSMIQWRYRVTAEEYKASNS